MLLKRLFLAAVFALPFMRPAVHYPVVAADLLFLALGIGTLWALLAGSRSLRWRPAYWVLLGYGACLGASITVSPDPWASLFKIATTFYLLGLAILVDQLVDTTADLRAAFMTWIGAAAIVAATGTVALVVAPFAPGSPLVAWASNEFGSLPAAAYIRLRATFFMASMMCNYMTVAAGLVLVARSAGWLGPRSFVLLLAAITLTAVMSLSPGVGGIALLLGIAAWLRWKGERPTLSALVLAASIAAATLMVVAMSLTPIPHDTAPFSLALANDLSLWPAVRFLTWSEAWSQWMHHFWLGRGIGTDEFAVPFRDQYGDLRRMTDAHNIFLNIAAQSGIVGLGGLVAVIVLACRLTFNRKTGGSLPAVVPLGLGLIFLNAFAYQGLGGSFEDARHLWVLLGLLLAADRLARRPGSSLTDQAEG